MKKTILIMILVLLSFITTNTVKATDWEDSFAGIAISVNNLNGAIIDGHIDLLVPRSDFENEIDSNMNSDFKLDLPNYADFDYLDDTEWISYCAFVEEANCNFNPEYDFFEFATHKDELNRLDDVKFIHVDGSGNTVVISEVYNVPNPMFFQDFSNLSYYDISTNEFQSDMSLSMDDIYFFVLIVVLFFAVSFAGVRTAVVYLVNLEFNKKLMMFVYYIIAYLALFIIGYTMLSTFEFIQKIVDSWWMLVVYLTLLSLIEITGTYFLIFKNEDKKEYLKYVIYSYGIMLLIFLILTIWKKH